MNKKSYISPAIKVRKIARPNILAGSDTEKLEVGTQKDTDGYAEEGVSAEGKRSGFHWGPIDGSEN